MALEKPNYTQIPNDILGDVERGNRVTPGLMAEMKEGELKLYLAVSRLTFGFHQTQKRAPLRILQDLTGLSKQGVLTAAKGLESKDLIERVKDGGVTLWKAKVKNLDNLDNLDVKNLDIKGQKFRHPSKKETIKETKRKESAPEAVKVYRKQIHRYPPKSWYQEIETTIGEEPADLERWGEVLHAYVGCGWNPTNVKAQLEFYRRHEIPGTNGAHKNAHQKNVSRNSSLDSQPTFNPATGETVAPRA